MSPKTPTALIAEDEPLLALALQAELAQVWPALQIAATVGDGLSAVAQALALRPDVLFFDIRMPGQNGLEAAAALADAWPLDVPFPALVFVTAYDQHALEAFEAQAVDYLLKPVEIQSFRQILDRIRETLDEEANDLMEETLTRLLCGEAVDEPLLCSLFSSRMMRFGLVRQCNWFTVRCAKFRTAQLRQWHQAGWIAFYGRDEQ